MKKRTGTVAAVLVIACLVIGLYMYINQAAQKQTEGKRTLATTLLSRDLSKDYPPTPYAAVELYCKTVEAMYNAETKPEQIEQLIQMQYRLFDAEFAAINPLNTLTETTKNELEKNKSNNLVLTGFAVDRSTNVEKWTEKDGKNYASLKAVFSMRNKKGSGDSVRLFTLREDENGRMKILGWKILD